MLDTGDTTEATTRGSGRASSVARRLLLTASAVHFTNDACFSILYPLLPLIAADLHLSYTQVGLLKGVFSGASSALQIPVGMLGERAGEGLILLLGNAWVGLGVIAMALTGGFALLLAAALLAGLGGNAQHPLAASLVSRSASAARMSTAMGTLNFAGDLGKLVGPLVAGIVATAYGWRVGLGAVGVVTLLFSTALLTRRRVVLPVYTTETTATSGIASSEPARSGFRVLLLIGGLDSATRGAALTFLPFILDRHGLSAATISAFFGLIFAAGAAGKFGCGWLGDRWGLTKVIVASELLTALTLLAFLRSTPVLDVPLALLFGFGLNGTSSALTAAVAHFVPAERRARGYGVYFTASLVSSALAPLVYGVLGDQFGLTVVFLVMAALTAIIAPLITPIRQVFAAAG